jgi:hypothetical protein
MSRQWGLVMGDIIQVRRGNTQTVVISVTTTSGGPAKDLTGYTLRGLVADKFNQTLLEKLLRVDTPTAGVVFWDWTVVESRSLPADLLKYEIEARNTTEQVTLLSGALNASGGINTD